MSEPTTTAEVEDDGLAECHFCQALFPEADVTYRMTYRQTLETPAEYEPMCPACADEEEVF